MGESGQKAALAWTAVFAASVGLFFGLGLAPTQKIADGSLIGGVAGGAIAAVGTIFAGWLAFVAGRRQTQQTLEQQILLRNRETAQALRHTALLISAEVSTADAFMEAIENWATNPTGEALVVIGSDELPNTILAPIGSFGTNKTISQTCMAAFGISRSTREICRLTMHVARQLEAASLYRSRHQKRIAKYGKSVRVNCAMLTVVRDFLSINADTFADSTTTDTPIKQLSLGGFTSACNEFQADLQEVHRRLVVDMYKLDIMG